jgi:hypothetical protein
VRKNLWNVRRKNVYYPAYFFYGRGSEICVCPYFIRENLLTFDGFTELYGAEEF